ncbi:MAG: NAD(P)-binding protein [Magnetococcales bacterium]|nr:NAD(P)-binding protein [Magnetococcales bacterium]
MTQSNHYLDTAKNWPFTPMVQENGLDRQVAYGDKSVLCPTYSQRVPPCSHGCPAGEDIRGYNNILRGVWKHDNPWQAAFYRLTETNPFPAVMGRVCPAPCQKSCNRQYRDETVGINAIEHAIGQYAIDHNLAFPKPIHATGKRVAVVGSGPGGLSCAYHLARKGHAVTLFERDPKLGGMMRYGIMGYRVDRSVLEKEIQRIVDLGIEVRCNVRIGTDISLDELRKSYDAVFLGVGAQKGRNLPIPGSEGPGVTNAIAFLREFELVGGSDGGLGAMGLQGKRVAVIGDGDVAMDVARLALRLGASSTLLSGVAREEMNCSAPEFDEAKQEGTDMLFQTGTVSVERNASGAVTGLKCTRMVRKEKGEEGWNHAIPFFRYKPEAGSEFTLPVDIIVASIGQTTDMAGLEQATGGTPWLQVDVNGQIQGQKGLFGGGDAVRISLLTTAIGQGRKAAETIDLQLRGIDPPKLSKPDVIPYKKLKWDYFPVSPLARRSLRHFEQVVDNWQEGLTCLTPEKAVAETSRCMSCGLCFECNQCMLYCPKEAITKFKGNPEGQVMFTRYERCVGCHICAEVCPTGYIDMGMGHV